MSLPRSRSSPNLKYFTLDTTSTVSLPHLLLQTSLLTDIQGSAPPITAFQSNDEFPWNFFVTELYRVQGASKLPYQILPTFLQVDYRSEYLDLLRYEIGVAVENYNTMILGWWVRLAAWIGGRVFELHHVDAAIAQLKEKLLDPEMGAGWMNERLSPLGRGIFVRFR